MCPSSRLAVWEEVLALVAQAEPHARVLDIGPGRGKGAPLLREYVAGVERVEAIEAHAPYVTERLRSAYDSVTVADVRDLPGHTFDAFDVVLMIDVLEHLAEGDGEALLRRVRPRMVICTPAAFFQNPEAEGVPSERHRSLWSPDLIAEVRPCEVAYVSDFGAVLARTQPLS